jgi:hypothetical protein
MSNVVLTTRTIVSDAIVENGFENRTDSEYSFDDPSLTFTIQPVGANYTFWADMVRHVKSAPEQTTIPDVEGIHFLYFDRDGAIQNSQIFSNDLLVNYAWIALVYWDADNKVSTILEDERHGHTMDSRTHTYLHNTVGAAYSSGLALGSITTEGTGDNAVDAQMAIQGGVFFDEDIRHQITPGTGSPVSGGQKLEFPAKIPVFYLNGAAGDWRKIDATFYPITTVGSGRAAWNQYSGGVWSLAEVNSNDYVLYHIFATGDDFEPIISVVGQSMYPTIADAQTGAQSEINNLQFGLVAGLVLEHVPLGTIIVQTSDGYANGVKSRIRITSTGYDYIDWRFIHGGGGGGTSVSDHGNLTGLLDDDHPQYTLNAYDTISDGINTASASGRGNTIEFVTPDGIDVLVSENGSPANVDVVNISPANDLAAIEGLGTTGIAVRTAADTWATRSLVEGTGISITNPAGIGGNITISATGGGTGTIAQVLYKNINTTLTTTAQIPIGSTPTPASGTALDSLAITMKGDNTVRCEMLIPFECDDDNTAVVAVISRSTAGSPALEVVSVASQLSNKHDHDGQQAAVDFYDTPGTGTHTYYVRVGPSQAHTLYINRTVSVANPWGGTLYRKNCNITLTEIVI